MKIVRSFLLMLLSSLLSLGLQANPYAEGGSQYTGAYTQQAVPQASNPYASGGSLPPQSYQSPAPIDANVTVTDTNSPSVGAKPWNRVGQWFDRKTNQRVTGKPEIDLANQRIQSGKARIKAVKAREKLEKHIANCKLQTDELTREAEQAEEQARLLENQVKFQESSLSAGR